ncbi:MAG: nucleotidyltransferase domain-containing protein [Chthoniobacter sp.]|nr:nucleotidyltransferase domain-containing protein [Chthoniobacter sp.]
MHGNEVFQRVRHALAQVEAERNVRVLFACESGSRAWGFASRDSDYDVRFLYVHRRDWYLSVEDRRDVIEQPIADDLDVSGWELRKALRLLRKSNPPLLEWLKSPVVYRHDPVFAAEFGRACGEVLFAAALLCTLPAHGLRQLARLPARSRGSESEEVSLRLSSAPCVPLDRASARPGADALRAARGERARRSRGARCAR